MFLAHFGATLKFWKLYQFLKLHKEYKWNRDIPHESCACEICENVRLFTTVVNRKIKDREQKLPTTAKDIVEKYSCNANQAEYMTEACPNCPKVELPYNLKNQAENYEESDDADNSDDEEEDDGNRDITYYMWTTIDSKVQKVASEVAIDEIQSLLEEKIDELKKHIYVKCEQQREYNRLKHALKPGEFIVHVDYAESYKNEQQDEIQSAYFGHETFSLFTACCYAREIQGGELKKNTSSLLTQKQVITPESQRTPASFE